MSTLPTKREVFPEFKIVGATPEEEHLLLISLSHLPQSHRKIVEEFLIVSEAEWVSYCEQMSKLAGSAHGPARDWDRDLGAARMRRPPPRAAEQRDERAGADARRGRGLDRLPDPLVRQRR